MNVKDRIQMLKVGILGIAMAGSSLSVSAQDNAASESNNKALTTQTVNNTPKKSKWVQRGLGVKVTGQQKYKLVDGTEITVLDGKVKDDTSIGYDGPVMIRVKKGKENAYVTYKDLLNYNVAHPLKEKSYMELKQMSDVVKSIARINSYCIDEPDNPNLHKMLTDKVSGLTGEMKKIHENTMRPDMSNEKYVFAQFIAANKANGG